ncbi:MAG TPA: CotH kinase family protein [Candidatus Saccharimonadales bacterium]|nr:CotH kinase family protein [Candidatus Saccharimonadales bacterium]
MDQIVTSRIWIVLLAFFLGLESAALHASQAPQQELNEGVAAVLQTTNVWVVHFRFTSEAWKTLQPETPPQLPDDPHLRGANGTRNGFLPVSEIDFKYVRADLEVGTNQLQTVAVRLKGNSSFIQSEKSLKHSIKVDLNEFVKGQKFGTMTKLNFHNCVTDPSWMNEVLSYQLYRDAGVPAPRTAYAKVYVTVPGEHDRTYLGLYAMVEDVDRPFAAEHFGSKKGAMFKPVSRRPLEYMGDDWSVYRQVYDPKWEISEEHAQRLIDFCKLVSKADDKEFANRISGFLDIDEFSRFMAVTAYLSTLDSLLGTGQNYYVHVHPEYQTMKFIPWDLDNSFGQFPMIGTQAQREHLSLQKPWVGENRFLERVFKLPTFQMFYKNHLQVFQVTIFKPARLEKQLGSIAAAIRGAIREESLEKLALFEQAFAGRNVPAKFGFPGQRRSSEGPEVAIELKPIRSFVNARYESVAAQLGGRSRGEIVEHRFSDPPEHLGPGMTLAPEWLQTADANKDGKVTREEWLALASRWHAAWSKGGKLGLHELRMGIETAFRPAGSSPRQGDFGPGYKMCTSFLQAMDRDNDGLISRTEFQGCFSRWFHQWADNGSLDEAHLRDGINRELGPPRLGPGADLPFGRPNGQ